MSKHLLTMIAGGTVGAVVTLILQKQGLTAVVASSLVGLAGAAAGHLLQLPHLPAVVFAGSFVGMTNPQLASWPLISMAGAFSGLLYHISLHLFAGFGGRLGTLAFISTLLFLSALAFLKKIFLPFR